LLGVAQSWHRHLAHDEQLVRAQQHAVRPGKPGARHIEDDVIEMRGDQVEQARHHFGIEGAHLGGAVRGRYHRQTGRMV
jgi:hypothetical protein